MRTIQRLCLLLLCLALASCNLGTNTLPNATVEVIEVSSTPRISLSCEGLVDAALATVGDLCGGVGRNQVCYGNQRLDVEFQGSTAGPFNAVGDITNLLDLHRISTTPLDESAQTWGIAVLKAQTNLSDTLPGQNVTFILFGDTSLEDASPDMQAVSFQTGVGQSSCVDAPPNAMLLQSPQGEQVSINVNGATLTLGSTLYITAVSNGEMLVATIEGTGIVSALGSARVVQPGAQVRLPLGGDTGLQVIGPPSEPEPFDLINIQRAPLTLLPEVVALPQPIALPGGATVTPPSVAPAVITQTSTITCVPRADWTGTYTVQRGDTLSAIARRYNLSLSELQDGNCIADANLISVGQVLAVPVSTAPVVTAAGTNVVFTVDDNSLNPGECTTVRWNVSGSNTVYFADESVTPQGSQEVCPSQSSTYTLLIVDAAGNQRPYTVSVTVTTAAGALLCPNQFCDEGETYQTCPADCPTTPATCGNQICEPGEGPNLCPQDCLQPICGNQICEPNGGENLQTCSRDCG